MKIDTLIQDCYEVQLLQDNSVIEVYSTQIKSVIDFRYGDTGGDTLDDVVYDTLRQVDIDGRIYYDFRPHEDVNPKIIFWNMQPNDSIVIGPYIDVEYKIDYALGGEETDFPEEELRKLYCRMYSFNGVLVYEGMFGDIFDNSGRIKCRYVNVLLIIRFKNDAGWFSKKKYYIDYYNDGNCSN
jgi:hypothetical protein